MKKYHVKLFWKDGTVNEGYCVAEDSCAAAVVLFSRLGFGHGAVAALDYWSAEEVAE